MKKKGIIILSTIIAVVIILGFVFKDYLLNEYYHISIEEMDEIPEKSRLLVIAPHCDDETLGSAGLIQQVLNSNGKVKVTIVTNGDGSSRSVKKNYGVEHPNPKDFIDLGYTRQQESIFALESLGVRKEDIYFLGYPDGGMDLLWAKNWNADNPFDNFHTQTSYTPYINSYRLNAVYAGENVAKDIMEITEAFSPTLISYPHPNDKHRDHWAIHAFVKYSLLQMDIAHPKELLYLVHRNQWPTPTGKHPKAELKPPRTLLRTGTVWNKLSLNDKVYNQKSKAIQFYKTQMKTMRDFLLSFERKDELFGEYPPVSIPFYKVASSPPQMAIMNPTGDNLWDAFTSSGNIKAILIGKDNNNLRLDMQVSRKIPLSNIYEVDMTVFFNDKEPIKFSATYDNGNTTTSMLTKNGQEYGIECHAEKESRSIIFQVSFHSIDKIKSMLVNGKTYKDDNKIDSTAWRVVQFN